MKILVAGDIHGSAYYCEKLLDMADKINPDKIVLTGDVLYHGPRNDLPEGYAPKKVIELVNNIADKILCVRGNCEAEVDQMVLSFPCLADYIMIYDNNYTFFVTHGHIYNNDNIPPFAKGTVMINGHTHIPAFDKKDGYTYLNPGSVSIPKENSENSFIVIENDKVMFYNTDGQIYKEGRLD